MVKSNLEHLKHSVAAITSPTPQSTLEVSSLAGDLKSLFITGLGTDFTIFCDSLKPPGIHKEYQRFGQALLG